jgi:prolipoprotein diacylglyceryltransferase
VVAKRLALWRQFCSGAESIANAWKEVSIGPARLLLHGGFIALGAVVGFAIAIHLAGPDQAGWILAMTCASVIGAAVWAQLIEGSSQLLRPYGYFGSVIGAAAVAVIGAVAGLDGWHVFTAFGVGGAFTQAIGRLRCLTQGCCHGRRAVASIGIRHTNPHSRVVRFTDFAGVPLHPTPVYSLIWMLLVGATLLRLWALAAPLPLIAGSYFILTGIGRFVEEHYRGEPQTPTHYGLRLYQWLAIAFVIGGAVLTTLGANPAPATHRLDASIVPTLLIVAALTFAAYGVDFPQSSRRFSRLA